MARLIQVSPIYENRERHYVYANTGRERVETLDFIDRCDKEWGLGVVWLEAVVDPEKGVGTRHRIVTRETAVTNQSENVENHPFEDVVAKYGLPSNSFPHCTRELKIRPITSYLREIGVKKYETAIGIRADEPNRAHEKPGVVYPMVQLGITEKMVREFWSKQPFDLGLKDYQGNCDLCFKKSLRKRLTILRETPEIAEWWSGLEGSRVNNKGLTLDLVFDRTGLSVKNLLELSADSKLEVAVDKHDARLAEGAMYPEMFEFLSEVNWDHETSCHCAST